MPSPFFSIIITTHERAPLLERAILSLTRQQFDDCEILVISDEGSHDTFDAAQRNLRKQDTFIRRSGLPGPAKSRNIGLQLAQGKFCMFLDDDDSHTPNCLVDLFDTIEKAKGEVFYFDYELIVELRSASPSAALGRTIKQTNVDDINNLICYNFIPNNALAISADIAKNQMFDELLRSHEDWDFLLGILRSGHKFTHVPMVGVSVYHDSENRGHLNETARASGEWAPDFLHIYRRWPAITEEQRKLRHTILKRLGHDIPLTWL